MFVMIILLSGEKKYSVEGEALDKVNSMGREIFEALERNDIAKMYAQLSALHSYVKENGTRVDPYKNADAVIPPADCDAKELRDFFNLQKTP